LKLHFDILASDHSQTVAGARLRGQSHGTRATERLREPSEHHKIRVEPDTLNAAHTD
jgi:hypothetical protein